MTRLMERNPNQNNSYLCAPAAYFFCLLNSRPDIYKNAVKSLWETGTTKIKNLTITPKPNGARKLIGEFYYNDRRTGKLIPKIPPIDWITLGSLRDSENSNTLPFNQLDGMIIYEGFRGVNFPSEVKTWFIKSGFNLVAEIGNMPYLSFNKKEIVEINQYAGTQNYIITLVSSSILKDADSPSVKNHYIVWTNKLIDAKSQAVNSSSNISDNVRLQLFSWGRNASQLKDNLTLENLMKNTFYAFAVSRKLGI